jgi:hypothetical protein
MKAPEDIAAQLCKQWQQADRCESRLASESTDWPLRLPIGKPTANHLANEADKVRAHIQTWQSVTIGQIEWQSISYRATGGAVEVPIAWNLARPSEWVAACNCAEIAAEYAILAELCGNTPESDHAIWFRKRHLWRDKPTDEMIRASKLADALTSGCADGRPLRALPYAGVDTKFYERHRALIVHLLDQRHDGAVSEQGLEVFLDAAPETTHWLLLADLDGDLLPFKQQRVRADELAKLKQLPGTHLLLVENDRALHLLPPCKGTLAVLGSGNDLSWLSSPSLTEKQIAYWGDLDTWGLRLLAHARRYLPELPALLMDAATFHQFAAHRAVVEPERAKLPSADLSIQEHELFDRLTSTPKGRLEQEFLPEEVVHQAVSQWRHP